MFKRFGHFMINFPIEYIIGIDMILLGAAILISPIQVSFLVEKLHIPAVVIAISFFLSGALIFTKPKLQNFVLLTIPYITYVVFGFLTNLSLLPQISIPLVIYVGFYILMLKVYQIKIGGK